MDNYPDCGTNGETEGCTPYGSFYDTMQLRGASPLDGDVDLFRAMLEAFSECVEFRAVGRNYGG